jgi:hypothetical protein
MAILPNKINFNNLILTGHDYEHTEGGLGSLQNLLKLYVKRADGSIINADAPLLAPLLGVSFKFNLKTILNNRALFPNDAIPNAGKKGIWRVNGLTERILLTINNAPSAELDIIFASLPQRVYYKYEQTYFSNLDRLNKPFLSIAPAVKKTKSTTPQYLYYLNNLSITPTSIKLYAQVYLYDNTLQKILLSEIATAPNDVLGCTVGLQDIIANQTIDSQNVAKYAIYLADQYDKRITEIRHFIIDDSFQEDTQVLLFRNNFNVFDTLEFEGTYSSTNDYVHSSFISEKSLIDYNSEITQKIIFRTGALEQNFLEYISDVLMTSDEIYRIRPDGSRVRLSKLTKSLKTRDEKSVSDIAEIEFRIANV